MMGKISFILLTMKTMNLDCDACFTFRIVLTKEERCSRTLKKVNRQCDYKPTSPQFTPSSYTRCKH